MMMSNVMKVLGRCWGLRVIRSCV